MKAISASLLKYFQFTLALILILGSAKAQLRADFTANTTSGCSPIIVSFTDNSTGNPTNWKWDLGNGTNSFLQNPSVSYITPGTYSIKLVISNGNQQDSIVKQQYITVNATPTVNFSALITQGCYPLNVNFTDLSIANNGTINQWQWDFGDGTIATNQNPSHIYTAEGNYDVKLKVTNSNGCFKVLGKSAYIKVEGGVKANFNYSVAGNCAPPTPVTFNNTSSGTGTLNFQWWFGDGTSSTDANPVHSYTAPGSYTVTLITQNTFGCTDTLVKTNTIIVGSVQANFTIPTSICAGSAVSISNTSTPATVSSNWIFGDGSFSTEINPVKAYSTAGTYTIKLINNFGACTDSIVKTITVNTKPTALFTATNNIACSVPATVQFLNNSVGGVSYQWNFGNGNTSTLQNPTHTFTSFGNFTVGLVAIAANGCSDTITKNSLVKINAPKINSVLIDKKEGCLPLIINATANVNSTQAIASYQWTFGDGSFSSAINPAHTYTTEGVFTIQLIITTVGGCSDTLRLQDTVKVGHKPTADFSGTPRNVCPTTAVQFTDASTNGPIDRWYWWFGDSKRSTLQNPLTSYSDTGFFSVRLAVWNNGCSDTISKSNYIYVKPPVARFSHVINDCNNKLKVRFIDSSKGAQTYIWDFGDGTTSTLANPVHTYAVAGTYVVTMSVFTAECSHSKARTVIVDDHIGILKVSADTVCRNSVVNFTIDSVNNAFSATYKWKIGSASVITTNIPQLDHTFTQPGSYPVFVEIIYSNGCIDTLRYTKGIKVYGPTANFNTLSQQYCAGTSINFTESSITDGTHSISNWTWNFGDGNIVSYTAAPFTHQYTNAGNFGVLLKVSDLFGCTDSIYKANAVSISKSVAAFTENDTLICPNTTLQLTSQSTGNNLTYQWDLGDGSQSSLMNPSHVYTTQGTYTIKLAVKDQLGCTDTLIKLNRVKVYLPVARFAMSDSTAVCPPLLVNMTNSSINAGYHNWTFGDGSSSTQTNPSHLFTYPGNYTVKLKVNNTGGCADSLTKQVFINGPTGTFSYIPNLACSPVLVSFNAITQNTVKNIWDFNDGSVNTTTQNSTSYTYTIGGHYIPKLILEDAQGCRVAIVGKDTIQVKEVKAFIANPIRTICDSANIQFIDSTITNDLIAQSIWSFGDGGFSTVHHPSHTYNANGLYSVKLKVITQTGCTDSVTYSNVIKVVASPKAAVNGDTVICKNGSILFTSNRINADTSAVNWYWSFGNGNTSTLQNPSIQNYTVAGNYNLIHKITNSSGCETITSKRIRVNELPNINAGADAVICRNQSYNLTATGGVSYNWTGNVTTINCTNCANPIAKPLIDITYVVTGKNGFNCIASDTINIKVQQPMKLNVIKADTLCLGATKTIKATGTDKYSWYPSLYIDNPNAAEVNIRPAKDTLMNYMVIGKDNNNCFSDTSYVKIKAYPIPKMEIRQDEIVINAGSTVKLAANNSADVTKWKWTPAKYLDNTSIAEPTMTAKESITYVCVASNQGNCVTRDEVKITVVCNNGNIFVPNTFSPNGDGNNDIFYPRGKGVYTIKSFRVFSRWGELVFEKTNFQANDINSGWDGTFRGQKLAADAYVYSLEIMCDNNTVVPTKGSVTLIR